MFDGKEAVVRYYKVTRAAFPDQRNKLIAMHDADDATIVGFDLFGPHKAPMGSIAPTTGEFNCRMTAFFFFARHRIVCERVYFDSATIQRQLGIAPQT